MGITTKVFMVIKSILKTLHNFLLKDETCMSTVKQLSLTDRERVLSAPSHLICRQDVSCGGNIARGAVALLEVCARGVILLPNHLEIKPTPQVL